MHECLGDKCLGECLGESLGKCLGEGLGECLGECSGKSLGECLGECLRFISASFAAAASACAHGVGVRLCGLEVRIRVRQDRRADRWYLFVRFVAL